MIMKKLIFLLLVNAFVKTNAQQLNIIPKPSSVLMQMGTYSLNKKTVVQIDFKQANATQKTSIAKFCNSIVKKNEFTKLGKLYIKYDTKLGNEAYQLYIGPSNIIINGNEKGIQYALESLQQLVASAENNKLQNCLITDSPRFAYRGMHLDVARHFQSINFIKKYLDYMAMYKFNTFHWHLTDDQGWRIEIKKYPKLTSIGGWRNGTIIGRYPGTGNTNTKYGGFYTQKEIKEIVEYAADRNISVIPEIEMPGHASAAIAAYPELSCFPNEPTKIPNEFVSTASKNNTGKLVQETWGVFEDVFAPTQTTFIFLQNVLDEVMPLFPSKLIHIGGDECPKESWKRSAFCQQLIKEKGLKDEHELQSYFIQRIEKYVNSKGKNIIGWDEILEGGLAPNATVMSWRGEKGGIEAAQQKHNVVMTPGSHCYFDHSQSRNEDSVTIGGYTSVEKVYSYEPIPKELNAEQAKYVLGAQANVWTEYITNSSKIEYQIFPRMLALSEVLWSDTVGRQWEEFEPRLVNQMEKLKSKKINLSTAFFDLNLKVSPNKVFGIIDLGLSSKNKNSKFVQIIPDDRYAHGPIFKDSLVDNIILIGKSISLNLSDANSPFAKMQTINFSFNKATAQKITLTMPPSKGYPGNGGAFGLVNGVVSEKGINSIEWLGFAEGQDCEATIDLGSVQDISETKIHTLDQQGSWIYLPQAIDIYTSNDGINFTLQNSKTNFVADTLRMKYVVNSFDKINCRYVRLHIKNYGQIPNGQPGSGHQAWLFVDEIQIASPNPSKGGE